MPKAKTKTKTLSVPMEIAEYRNLKANAKLDGRNVSAFVRRTLRNAKALKGAK